MFEEAGAGEGAIVRFEALLAAMFGDDERAGGEEGGGWGAELVEGRGVFFGGVVGGVEKDDVEDGRAGLELAEEGGGGAGVDGDARGEAQAGEIGAEDFEGGWSALDEGDAGGTAAESLDGDCAGAGIEVEEGHRGDAGCEDVEECLAEAVAGGAGRHACGGLKRARAECSGDDTHANQHTRRGGGRFRRGVRWNVVVSHPSAVSLKLIEKQKQLLRLPPISS